MSQKYTDLNKDRSLRETSSDQIKRTDVNILLNRVKLDQKRTLKKNILISFLLVGLVSSITILFII